MSDAGTTVASKENKQTPTTSPTHEPLQPSPASATVSDFRRLHDAAGNHAADQLLAPRAGESLDVSVRSAMESRFGQDFSGVRIHRDRAAAKAERARSARAYTVGQDIVFAAGEYAPGTKDGLKLLAHELTHTLQQRRSGESLMPESPGDTASEVYESEANRIALNVEEGRQVPPKLSGALHRATQPMIQRVGLGETLARFFGGGTFTRTELREYLNRLDESNTIEDDFDSDNKARAIVNSWKSGDDSYALTAKLKALLIREMQSGFTGADDEQAILELLERSDNNDLFLIFSAGGVNARELNDDFHTAEWTLLQDFYERRFEGGLEEVLAGRLRPKGEPVPRGIPLGDRSSAQARQRGQVQQPQADQCSIRTPQNCATYSAWLEHFNNLPTFIARSGHAVLGERAPRQTATDPTAAPGERRPTLLHSRSPYLPTDRFIDGPTDEWVRANLPENLVRTAYQLPSDCADIAVILRHVWLSAHHRTESYRGWVCGSALGEARSDEIGNLISNTVYTGNVNRAVNPYSDERGRPILQLSRLQNLLHPGDILVWEHHDEQGNRRGGHTHTITAIERSEDGQITQITALQGNLPISRGQAVRMRAEEQQAGRSAPSIRALQRAPGRRIERSTLSGADLQDINGVWTWDNGTTTLVAAGPPAAAQRPAVRRRRGQPAVRRLSDWLPAIRRVSDFNELIGNFEAGLYEARAMVEGGRAISTEEAQDLGRTAGESLWRLAREANDLADESHFRSMQRMRAMLAGLRDDSRTAQVRVTFNTIDRAFHLAARGASTIDFRRRRQEGRRVVKVLLTGFDPFNVANIAQAPRPGVWNPSGAAVLALDGTTIQLGRGLVAAVEGIVLPVRFQDFRAGLVESIIRPHLQSADAVITVSLDPGIAPTEPVDVERYAVGVHRLIEGRLEPIPPAPGGTVGPAIIESRGALGRIAQETARSATGGQSAIPRPTVDTEMKLQFVSRDEADRALQALGLPRQGRELVTISNMQAVRQIASTAQRPAPSQSAGITFQAGGRTFSAVLERGPGGSFLSNEVSFRVLRLIGEAPQQARPSVSFHVHTQRGVTQPTGTIPQDVQTPQAQRERQQALALAQQVRANLIETLKRMIGAVARQL